MAQIDPRDVERLGNIANPFGQYWTKERIEMTPNIKANIALLRSENYTFVEIAEFLQIAYDTIYDWKAKDLDFRKMLEWAEEARTDALEAAAMRRATRGTSKIVVSGGRVVMDPNDATKPLMVDEFDNGLTQFMLKGRQRETYGDKVDTNANINVRSDQARAELEARIRSLAEAEVEPGPDAGQPDVAGDAS